MGFISDINNRVCVKLAALEEKTAKRKAIRMIEQGLLKPESVKQISKQMGRGDTRQIGKDIIGRGYESAVFNGFTGGGVGDSVIKVPWDAPGSNTITGGSNGVKSRFLQELNRASPQEQMDIMNANKDLFAEVYGLNRRGGYAQQKMEEVLPAASLDIEKGHRYDNLRNAISLLRKIRSAEKTVKGHMGGFPANILEGANTVATDVINAGVKNRHMMFKAPVPESLKDEVAAGYENLYRRLDDTQENKGLILKYLLKDRLRKDLYRQQTGFHTRNMNMSDVMPNWGHNIMKDSTTGEYKITDPIFTKIPGFGDKVTKKRDEGLMDKLRAMLNL